MFSLDSTATAPFRRTSFYTLVLFPAVAMTLTLGCADGSSDDSAPGGGGAGQDSGANSDAAAGATQDASVDSAVDTGGTTSCLQTETLCGDECVVLDSDSNHCGGCGQQCGPAADCFNGQCQCGAGAEDCNGDMGSTNGTDGCECVGTCNGAQCVVQECSPDDAYSCGTDDDTVCNGGSCETCPAGTTNCDGLGTNGCECTLPCVGGGCPSCSYDEPGVCTQDQWCNNGTCTACAPKKKNCDTKGKCECEGDCDGNACAAMPCTYDEANACNGDDTMWCSSVAGNTCTSCSPGFYNCNNTAGCECDDAGCNGQECAGSCTGGEC